jgi:hypothetical protein
MEACLFVWGNTIPAFGLHRTPFSGRRLLLVSLALESMQAHEELNILGRKTLDQILEDYNFILTEAAIVERLRRNENIRLDPLLAHAPLIYNRDGRRADVICYAFSPDLLDASTKELLSFLKILSQYFPKTDNGDGGFRPMDNQSYIDTFNSAHQHVCELIAAKRAQARHR